MGQEAVHTASFHDTEPDALVCGSDGISAGVLSISITERSIQRHWKVTSLVREDGEQGGAKWIGGCEGKTDTLDV